MSKLPPAAGRQTRSCSRAPRPRALGADRAQSRRWQRSSRPPPPLDAARHLLGSRRAHSRRGRPRRRRRRGRRVATGLCSPALPRQLPFLCCSARAHQRQRVACSIHKEAGAAGSPAQIPPCGRAFDCHLQAAGSDDITFESSAHTRATTSTTSRSKTAPVAKKAYRSAGSTAPGHGRSGELSRGSRRAAKAILLALAMDGIRPPAKASETKTGVNASSAVGSIDLA